MGSIQHNNAEHMSSEAQNCGAIVRTIREAMGLSRAEAGRLSTLYPCSASTVARVERGELTDSWRAFDLTRAMGSHLAALHTWAVAS